jgi:hypothetical protein
MGMNAADAHVALARPHLADEECGRAPLQEFRRTSNDMSLRWESWA